MDADHTLFENELRQILGDLATAVGVDVVAIIPPGEADTTEAGKRLPLGGGAQLYVRDEPNVNPRTPEQHDAALERTVRAIRACARRWDITELPAVSIAAAPEVPQDRLVERIRTFLSALCATQNVANCVVTLHDDIVTSAEPLTELQRERIPFILKRLGAEADRRQNSSHAEILGDDLLAQTFWFGAALIAFFNPPIPEDFLRHRIKLVIRELSAILPSLDDPPRDPAKVQPIPE